MKTDECNTQAMDTVEFTRKGPTNELRIVKYFAQASAAP